MARARRPPARLRLAVCAFIVAVSVSTLAAVPADATIPAAKPSVADIEKQIDAANNKLEPLIEAYNKANADLAADKRKVAQLKRKLEPLQLEVDFTMAKLAPLIHELYEGGPTGTVHLITDLNEGGDLLGRLLMSDAIAHVNYTRIAAALKARDDYLAVKKPLDALVASLQLQSSDLAAQARTIQTQVDALQKLRRQVYGTSGAVGATRPVVCPYTYIGGAAGVAVRTACAQIGKPYVWSAAGPNTFDCSGLTLYAWGKAGKTLRHYTRWQWDDGTPISRDQLRPGDLVFFYPGSLHHMGIYVGGGWMVHAPHTGDVVRMARIDTYPIAGYRRP